MGKFRISVSVVGTDSEQDLLYMYYNTWNTCCQAFFEKIFQKSCKVKITKKLMKQLIHLDNKTHKNLHYFEQSKLQQNLKNYFQN